MENMNLKIRTATLEDAKALLDIYAPYVEKTAITFEYDVPPLYEFKERIEQTLKTYPYLVAVLGEEIVGYAYAGVYKGRAAYDWSCEVSVYVKEDCKRMGIGVALYSALEAALRLQGILNLYACISYPTTEDEYLTMDSIHFHEKMGYVINGHFHSCGYKFQRWYDMVWMEKWIGEHKTIQEEIKPYHEIEMNDQKNNE